MALRIRRDVRDGFTVQDTRRTAAAGGYGNSRIKQPATFDRRKLN